jgi:MurNAc alpha-1-phosphate uridylyltransferase
LKVGGKPLIVWHLERLAKAGFKEIVINHAHLGQQIEDALGYGSQWGLTIQYSPEKIALETAGGIANALPLLGDEPFLVVNGDIFTEVDFAQLKLNPNNLAHLVLVDNPPQHPNGDFAIEIHETESSEVKANGIKVVALKNHGSQMLTFSGVGVYHPDLFAGIVQGEPAKLAPLLRWAISEGRATAEHYQGVWHDIGTPERLISLEKSLNV